MQGRSPAKNDAAPNSPARARGPHIVRRLRHAWWTSPAARPPRSAQRVPPLVGVAGALAGGIALDRGLALTPLVWWLLAAAAWGLWLWRWRLRQFPRQAAAALLAAVAASGAAWHHVCWSWYPLDEIAALAESDAQPVCLLARLTETPQTLPDREPHPLRFLPSGRPARAALEVLAIRDGTAWRAASGRAALAVEQPLVGLEAGAFVRVLGQMRLIEPPANPGQFDFRAHRRRDRQLVALWAGFAECVEAIEPRAAGAQATRVALRSSGEQLSPVAPEAREGQGARGAFGDLDDVIARAARPSLIGRLRGWSARQLHTYVGDAQWGLAVALLLGQREQVEQAQTNAFFKSGTLHLLAISGLHVGIVAAGALLVLRLGLVPTRVALVAVAATTVGYALLAGAGPPIQRAATMVVLVCAARLVRRRGWGINALAAAAIWVLVTNPSHLFAVGPQLSFLAVATLIVGGRQWLRDSHEDPLVYLTESDWAVVRQSRAAARWLLAAVAASAAVWAVTMPLVAARFHLVSPVAVVAGPLLVPLVAVALLAGLGVLLTAAVSPPAASLCGWICGRALATLDGATAQAAALPYGHFWTPGPANWWLAGFYLAVVAWVLVPRWRPPRRWTLALASGWIAVGLASAAPPRSADRLDCTFLAVGHGCATVLELPGGQTMLYDAGRLGAPDTAARLISEFLWHRGIRHLDAVIISHADADHFNALPELVQRFSVGVVYYSPQLPLDGGRAVEFLLAALAEADIDCREVAAGAAWHDEAGWSIEVRHPPHDASAALDNANSIVLAIEYAGRRVLLPGDLESPGLEAVIAEEPYDCDLLLAPHHGSPRSDPPGFAGWSSPDWVVISGGDWRTAQPTTSTYATHGARVWHTARDGAVAFSIRADGAVYVESPREPVERLSDALVPR